jgi:diguanylate cyclase (GGDEF)-like protein
MVTTLASLQNFRARRAEYPSVAHRSRITRRVIGLFIVSALVPLCLCAAFLIRNFAAELNRSQQQDLDGIVRSFGMTLLGRLNSADYVLAVIVRQPAMTDSAIEDAVAKMPWVRAVRRVKSGESLSPSEQVLPTPDARQLGALRAGEGVLICGTDELGGTQVYLVRTLSSGAWLYTELTSTWLWADASDYAGGAALVVLDEHGERLTATGDVAPKLLSTLAPAMTAGKSLDRSSPARGEIISHGWMARSREVFLASRFSSPSWQLVALSKRPTLPTSGGSEYLYLLAFVLLTILMITWLSMTTIRRQLRPLELLMQATKRIAQRDFSAFHGMSWNDEFGDLARSFDAMSGKLKTQFAALETLADVDRLLLSAPDLELILDTLLPRVADLLGCDTVSVLLFDTDSNEHARAYDFYPSQGQQLPVRRIACDIAALRATVGNSLPPLIDARSAGPLGFLIPPSPQPTSFLRLQPLKHGGECVGALCVGYAREAVAAQDSGVTAADFADRLSLILANLKQAERLRRQANFDALTGLQNRHLFSEHVRTAIAGVGAERGMGCLLYIDLDHFKRVNDTAGHAVGDDLLCIVAERLTASAGEGHSIARLGGDEFAVLLPAIDGPDDARRVAERIITALEQPIEVDARKHHVSSSIGMAVFPADGTTLEELLKAGDIAMYHAKDSGRGRAVFFQSQMQQTLIERMKLESGMQRALQRDDFVLHYQPIVSEGPPGGLAVEALVRWPCADQQPWISPAVFVPVAEENGLIVKLGDWILRSACAQFARWRDSGVRLDYVSVNVSVRQLRESDFVATMVAALQDNAMQGCELQLEITESVLAHGAELSRTLSEIASHGVPLALDDFGTGYSSLSYLRSYPIQTVKIDRSFIVGLPQDPAACRLAESIIVMCAALGKHVVAEGVESHEQREFLRQAGCTTIQGYLLGRPMEAADIPGFARHLRSTVIGAAPNASGRARAL